MIDEHKNRMWVSDRRPTNTVVKGRYYTEKIESKIIDIVNKITLKEISSRQAVSQLLSIIQSR